MSEKHQNRCALQPISGKHQDNSQGFPTSELYGLTKQIRRATASIGANIAEGTGRNSGPDFGRFL